MSMTAAERASYEIIPATPTGFAAWTNVAVSTSPAAINLNGAWGGITNRLQRGGAYVRVEAPAGLDLFVVFTSAADTAHASLTNGDKIEGGKFYDFWVTAATPRMSLVVASGSGTARVRMSSRNSELPSP